MTSPRTPRERLKVVVAIGIFSQLGYVALLLSVGVFAWQIHWAAGLVCVLSAILPLYYAANIYRMSKDYL